MTALTVVTAASTPVLSMDEAKLHLRVDISDDDTLIQALVSAATAWAEEFMRVALITRTYDYWLDSWPSGREIELPMPPLQSVAGVYYYDENDTEYTLATSDYMVDANRRPGRVVLRNDASWPSVTLRAANGVRVRFTAGYGNSASDVPENIRHAIRLLLGHFYENRELVVASGAVPKELPFAARALLGPYRMDMLGAL